MGSFHWYKSVNVAFHYCQQLFCLAHKGDKISRPTTQVCHSECKLVGISVVSHYRKTLAPEMNDDNNASSSNFTTGIPPKLEPELVWTIRIVISAAICFVGVVGNFLVLLVTACLRKSKTAVNYYILNLAAADIGVLAICYPLTVVKAEDPLKWPLGRVVCEVFYPLTDVFYGVSIGSIVAIAIDRYRAIVRNVRPHQILKSAKWIVLSIWVVAFLGIVLPLYFVMAFIHDAEKQTTDCTPVWPSRLALQFYVLSLSTLWYAVPLVVILFAYRKIAQKIRISKSLHKSIASNMSSGQQPRGGARRRLNTANTKALKILVPVVLAFAGSMLPFHVFRLAYVFHPVSRYKYKWVVYNICTILLLANSAVNPIIYSLVSEEFKEEFKRILCLQCRTRQPRERREKSSTTTKGTASSLRSLLSGRKGGEKHLLQTTV